MSDEEVLREALEQLDGLTRFVSADEKRALATLAALAQRPRAGAPGPQRCDPACGPTIPTWHVPSCGNAPAWLSGAPAPVERAASKKAGGDPPIGEQLGGVATVNSDAREALPSPAPPAPVERTSDDRAPQAGGSRGDHRNLSREAAIGDIQPPPSAPVAPPPVAPLDRAQVEPRGEARPEGGDGLSAMFGAWPANDPRRWFAAGAAWWEYESRGATMWASDRDKAEAEAERRAARLSGPTDAVAARCEGCGARVAPDPETPDGRGHRVPNADGSPGYCGPISEPARGGAGPTDEELADLADQLHQARGDYWQVQRCPSCDDHGGHGREWSVWAGGAQGVRVAHGLDQHEALTIATHVNTLREAMEDVAKAVRARLAPGATGGTT